MPRYQINSIITRISFLFLICLGGCSSFLTGKQGEKNIETLSGPPYKVLHFKETPLHACITSFIKKRKKIVVSVEDILDKTGKYAANGYGGQVTAGFANMLISSLYQSNLFLQVERLRHDIILWDFKLINSKLFSKPQQQEPLEKPLLRPMYLITGSITELNFSIHSTSAELGIYGFNAGIRTFWVSVGVDIRVIDARNSQIVYVIPIKKQLWGYESKGGIYKIINTDIISANLSQIKKESMGEALREISQFIVDKIAEKLYQINCEGSVK